ncbi:MAG: TIGR02147 family protein [Alphaproteobacteria bacterium]|nr:TIGR02147 family protein [Alphaproteobacteria bacterium]MCB9690855.1 TIGR02147 family protein [Alphaproteobacteria bacterium]
MVAELTLDVWNQLESDLPRLVDAKRELLLALDGVAEAADHERMVRAQDLAQRFLAVRSLGLLRDMPEEDRAAVYQRSNVGAADVETLLTSVSRSQVQTALRRVLPASFRPPTPYDSAVFDPFAYDDYRELIRAWIWARPGRSQSLLARRAGVSRYAVAMILAGERHIPLASAHAWTDALGLSADGARYFELLVEAESPIPLAERRMARRRAAAMANGAVPLPMELLSKWFVPVILEMSAISGFQLTPEWIGPRIWPPVSEDELADACQQLNGVAERGWRLERTPSPVLDGFHDDAQQASLDLAARALWELRPQDQYQISFVTAVPRRAWQDLRQRFNRLFDDLHTLSEEDGSPDSVVHVGLQAFFNTREVDDG